MLAPAPYGATPSSAQLAWHAMALYGFVHFTVNTFTDREWGFGDEDPASFNPTALDARQWARVARSAGLTGLILTAKHHDGFCLWPSRYTTHSVKQAPWRQGKGDIVQDLYEACTEYGLKMGLYLSPWDRNHAAYGEPAYVDFYHHQWTELLERYPGVIFEIWCDGANGGDGYYGGARETRQIDRRTYYRFPTLIDTVRRLQPNAVIFSDAGPDVRWVGNESGVASNTCWHTINPEGMHVGEVDDLNRLGWGEPGGACWRPAEVDVSIRPGWFYHAQEQPRTVQQLLSIYLASIGNGCGLNLNLPPNRLGLIPDEDIRVLTEFRATLDSLFARDLALGQVVTASDTRGNDPAFAPGHLTDANPATYWATDDDIRMAEVIVEFAAPETLGFVWLEEFIALGQRIAAFSVEAAFDEQWLEIARGTTIGARKILPCAHVTTAKLRLRILSALACPVLSRLSVFAVGERR